MTVSHILSHIITALIKFNKLLLCAQLISDDCTSVKKVGVLLYDEIGELPQIAVATMTPSAFDTNSPHFGTPAPLLSTHEQKFISNGMTIL